MSNSHQFPVFFSYGSTEQLLSARAEIDRILLTRQNFDDNMMEVRSSMRKVANSADTTFTHVMTAGRMTFPPEPSE